MKALELHCMAEMATWRARPLRRHPADRGQRISVTLQSDRHVSFPPNDDDQSSCSQWPARSLPNSIKAKVCAPSNTLISSDQAKGATAWCHTEQPVRWRLFSDLIKGLLSAGCSPWTSLGLLKIKSRSAPLLEAASLQCKLYTCHHMWWHPMQLIQSDDGWDIFCCPVRCYDAESLPKSGRLLYPALQPMWLWGTRCMSSLDCGLLLLGCICTVRPQS